MKKESITISIPAFNEQETIKGVVKEALFVVKSLTDDYELLLINDGSTDKTGSIMKHLAKGNKHIRIIEHQVNKGFSSVITEGLFNSSKDLVLLAPADGQFDFKYLGKFVKAIQKYDGAIGYRVVNTEPIHRKIQSSIYHSIAKLLFSINLPEFSSVYMWRTSILKDIIISSAPNGNTAQVEIIFKVLQKGGKLNKIPIHWNYRKGGKPKGEINFKLIFLTLKDMWKLFVGSRIKPMLVNFSYYFTEVSVKFLTVNLFLIKKLIAPFIEGQKNVLDLGCGIGTMSTMFPRSSYLGIDIDTQAVELAKKNYPEYKFETLDATSFDIKEKFDLVLIVGVLHHLSDKDVNKTLECISRCLKTNGKIVIIEAIPPLFKWNFIGYILRANDKGHFIRQTEEYKELIERKFKIIRGESKFGGFFDYAFLVATN